MNKLKKPISFETTFGVYTAHEIIGQGGAGIVYGGLDLDGKPVALKVLSQDRASMDKRRRFKNEIAFLTRHKHPNLVSVIDHGISIKDEITQPFYVMCRYDDNLRGLIKRHIPPDQVLNFFSQILDGVEAAHFYGAVHRDLKPENILYDAKTKSFAVADFGIARFTDELLLTLVETADTRRLANFQYAAPEQRVPGGQVGIAADIYALGLILNEMFTGITPHGTDYHLIKRVSEDLGFLDSVVEKMLRQRQEERPPSIADVKALIQRYKAEAVSLQKLSQISAEVIKIDEIDEPLAHESPRLVDVDWRDGTLTLILDRPVTTQWVAALHQMGNYTSVYGRGPETFRFDGKRAVVAAAEHEVQQIIDYFKEWLPKASLSLRNRLKQAGKREEAERRRKLELERRAEEQRLRVLRNIKI